MDIIPITRNFVPLESSIKSLSKYFKNVTLPNSNGTRVYEIDNNKVIVAEISLSDTPGQAKSMYHLRLGTMKGSQNTADGLVGSHFSQEAKINISDAYDAVLYLVGKPEYQLAVNL